VRAVVRSEESCSRLKLLGIEAWPLDLDRSFAADELPAGGSWLYYFAPPPSAGNNDPRMARVCEVLQRDNRPEKLVYISTTGVYGDCGGEWIDESAPLRPTSARGRRRMDAEQQLARWSATSGVPVVVLRVPGIYGPGRLPLERLRKGQPVLRESEAPFSNRIHVDDLARICVAAMQRGRAGEIYNVSDGHPTSMTDYFNRVADRFGIARPPVLGRAAAAQQFSAAMLEYLSESKRVNNSKMLAELAIQLDYPDLERGLAAGSNDASG
jgi:nucleoside-diphosphate-sugar epimerase